MKNLPRRSGGHGACVLALIALLAAAFAKSAQADGISFSYSFAHNPAPALTEPLRFDDRILLTLLRDTDGAARVDRRYWIEMRPSIRMVPGLYSEGFSGEVNSSLGFCEISWEMERLGLSDDRLQGMHARINALKVADMLNGVPPAQGSREARRLEHLIHREYAERYRADNLQRVFTSGGFGAALSSVLSGRARLRVIPGLAPVGVPAGAHFVRLEGHPFGTDLLTLECTLRGEPTVGRLRALMAGFARLDPAAGTHFMDSSPAVSEADERSYSYSSSDRRVYDPEEHAWIAY